MADRREVLETSRNFNSLRARRALVGAGRIHLLSHGSKQELEIELEIEEIYQYPSFHIPKVLKIIIMYAAVIVANDSCQALIGKIAIITPSPSRNAEPSLVALSPCSVRPA